MLCGTKSLFQQVIERVNTLVTVDIVVDGTLIVTGEDDIQRFEDTYGRCD